MKWKMIRILVLNMDVNSAVEKHVDYDKRLVQMSTTQKNHKDTIDTHHAEFIKNRGIFFLVIRIFLMI